MMTMIALIQRVTQGRVTVDGATVGAIGPGLLALLCAERNDAEPQADALLDKLLFYRVFADDEGRMNRSLRDVAGELLLVPQFTLAAETSSGTRPRRTWVDTCSSILSRRRESAIRAWRLGVSAPTCRSS
jgi:D-tyrosyl-tRNA(Tyr) deacylase